VHNNAKPIINPNLPEVIYAQASQVFTPRANAKDLHTTWTLDEAGNSDTLEARLNLPTHYPLEPDNLDCGSFAAFKAAQSGGRLSARVYSVQEGENSGDSTYTQQRRQRIYHQIMRNCGF